MRKSRLDVKPHYHTQEGPSDQSDGNPVINVMISHTSSAEARQSVKSSRHWFAQSPPLSVLHERTHARKDCNTQTIRDGPLAQEADTSSPPPKTTTTAGQTHEQTTRQPCKHFADGDCHTAKLKCTCVVAMRFLIVCMAMCSLNNPC